MSNVPNNFFYTKEHEWVEDLGNNVVRVGITDFAQSALGDIVYVQAAKLGESVTANKVFSEVESTKSVSEIYAPVSGKISKINEALDANPEIVNQAPYGEGWLVEIELSSALAPAELLSAADYTKLISGE